jgi:hypothetical protein
MEIIIGLIVVVLVGFLIYANRESRNLDINKDGKVDLQDAKVAVENTVEVVKETVKKTKARAAAEIKKPRGRKPKKG